MGWKLDIAAPVNGRIRKADITALDDVGDILTTARADLFVVPWIGGNAGGTAGGGLVDLALSHADAPATIAARSSAVCAPGTRAWPRLPGPAGHADR